MFQNLSYFDHMQRKDGSHAVSSISIGQKRYFFAVTLALPIILFALLEIGLRVFHYGPNLSLFITERIHGKEYFTMNPDIKYRYFSQVQFSPTTSPEDFAIEKPDSVYRIFCLGASTTVGYPYWYNGSFPTFLRERLQAEFPRRRIEIINLGLTATNSNTVVDIARELPAYDPDLIILYGGHNEFYGALGTASWESSGSSLWLTRLYLHLIHWKMFWLFRSIVTDITNIFHSSSPSAIERGTMMERMAHGKFIPYGSPLYRKTQDIYRTNLNSLKNICTTNHIPLMVCSQVSNVRDLFPFVSVPDSSSLHNSGDLPSLDSAKTMMASGRFATARILFEKLIQSDSLRADLHYYLAQCFDRLSDFTQAGREYIRARDYDQLRFRASTDFNRELARVADSSKDVFFVDVDRYFRAHSQDSIVGHSLIQEHLHPNSRGNFLIAKQLAESMKQDGLFASSSEWQRADTVSDTALWKDRPVSELDELLAKRKTEILTSAWPFTDETVPVVHSVAPSDTLGMIVERLARNTIDWKSAHIRAAQYYNKSGQKQKAVIEYRILTVIAPHDVQGYLQLARTYLTLGEYDNVKQTLLTSLSITPTILAYRALGDICINQNNPNEAISYYRHMDMFPQTKEEQLGNGYVLAVAYFKAGDMETARNEALRLLQVQPSFQPAVVLLQHIARSGTTPKH